MSSIVDINVHGLGHIGLPLACVLAENGLAVRGIDIDEEVVRLASRGQTRLREPNLADSLSSVITSGRLVVSTVPGPARYSVIAVPTPTDSEGNCDLGPVRAAIQSCSLNVMPGHTVIIESTVPPGTTIGMIKPMIESSGLIVGRDVFLAVCPERVLPGNTMHEIRSNARAIGGVTHACTASARDLYSSFVTGELLDTTAPVAEIAKLCENTFRDVNIALANQFADMCGSLGTDWREVLSIANHHPRVEIHAPGIGVGGHCIPVDPWFLIRADPHNSSLAIEARRVNGERPRQVSDAIRAIAHGRGARSIALLGLAYKPDTEDFRGSPAVEIANRIAQDSEIPDLIVYDPLVRTVAPGRHALSISEALESAELAVVLVAHAEFVAFFRERIHALPPPVFDCTGSITGLPMLPGQSKPGATSNRDVP